MAGEPIPPGGISQWRVSSVARQERRHSRRTPVATTAPTRDNPDRALPARSGPDRHGGGRRTMTTRVGKDSAPTSDPLIRAITEPSRRRFIAYLVAAPTVV